MDPFEVLRRLRAYVAQHEMYNDTGSGDVDDYIELCDNLANAFSALDQWMTKGGFSPWTCRKN